MAALAFPAALLLVLATVVALPRRSSALDRSIADLQANRSFTTSRSAGATLARISERLLEDGRSCRARQGDGRRCDPRLATAGWSSAAAVATLSCTQPGTQEIRRSLLDHLQALRRWDRRPGAGPPPEVPTLPRC